MASVTVSLDRRIRTREGLYAIRLVVSHHGHTARIFLGIHIAREEWNAARRVVIGNPNRNALNAYIAQRLTEARNALLQITATGAHKKATVFELRDMIQARINPTEETEESPVTFCQWYEQFVQHHENRRTREIYKATLNRIREYDMSADSRTFDDITKSWLDAFFMWCAKSSPSVNARNIHLRNIRAVFNDAIDNGITTAYPFRRMRITPVPTRKRSIPIGQLREIMTCDVPRDKRRYYDAFRLSFLLIGINLVDLCNLPKNAIQDGRLVYVRHKTHKAYSVKVEDEARAIIRRYRDATKLVRFCTDIGYRNFNAKLNRNMPDDVTAYSARHSWATVAASLDIPDDVIALALGHTPRNATTDIYIRRDLRKVDEANRRVIDYVLNK